MRTKFQLFLLVCNLVVAAFAQDDQTPSLHIGSPAPPLRVREWIRGKPIAGFEKGKVYVVECWATWCGPCIEEMPRLSALAHKYKGKVAVIGMNIYERKAPSAIKTFVDSMAHWMDYTVAAQDSNFVEVDWMDATGESGIPTSFVVDAEGRLAWIGYTANLPDALTRIVNDNWNLQEAMAERNRNKPLGKLGLEASKATNKYTDNRYMIDFYGEPDSALLLISQMVTKEPGLKYERFVALSTLHALLRKNPHKACEYASGMMASKDPSYDAIIVSIQDFPYQYNTLPPELFELGAEACQAEIDRYPWTTKTSKNYFKMADWYLRANNKVKAKQAMRKAIKALKSKKRKFLERSI